MPLELGAAFRPLAVEVYRDDPVAPTIEDLRTEQLLVALANLQDALNHMPAPVVNVAEPDLTAIVNAVTALQGPATPGEIARAIREEIAPGPAPQIDETLEKLTETLERLDFRMKGIGSSGGGGGPSTVSLSEATVTSLTVDQGSWDYEAGASGTVVIVGRVLGIAAHAPTTGAGSLTINGGSAIPVPAGTGIELAPRGTLDSPTLVFTGTDSYAVELVT